MHGREGGNPGEAFVSELYNRHVKRGATDGGHPLHHYSIVMTDPKKGFHLVHTVHEDSSTTAHGKEALAAPAFIAYPRAAWSVYASDRNDAHDEERGEVAQAPRQGYHSGNMVLQSMRADQSRPAQPAKPDRPELAEDENGFSAHLAPIHLYDQADDYDQSEYAGGNMHESVVPLIKASGLLARDNKTEVGRKRHNTTVIQPVSFYMCKHGTRKK
jgi:hypothetical protein